MIDPDGLPLADPDDDGEPEPDTVVINPKHL